MQPKTSWKFTTDLEQVNFGRIIKEANEAAGGAARCIRVTVDGKVYTLVAITLALVEPKSGKALGFIPKNDGSYSYIGHSESNPLALNHPFRSDEGRVRVPFHSLEYYQSFSSNNSIISHVLYKGDVVKEHLDCVKTTVEVF